MIVHKICIIGESDVGKNSLVRSVADRGFSDRYLQTVGVRISRRNFQLPTIEDRGNMTLTLMIWEIASEPKFEAIAPTYFIKAKAAIVVADVTRPQTIQGLPQQIERFLAINPESFIVTALNKSDLVDLLVAEEQRLQIVQSTQKYPVLGTYVISAKTGFNVNLMFEQVAHHFLNDLV